MKKSETLKIVQRLVMMFPSFKFGEMPEEFGGGVNPIEFWHDQIGDMEFPKAEEAVKRCINRCKFVPTAADIREEYEEIVMAEKKELGEIRRFYDQARSYYPGSGEYGNGWKEFQERCKTKEEAERLQNRIISYVNHIDRDTNDDCMDFVECIKTI